jgi:hypothetical protein
MPRTQKAQAFLLGEGYSPKLSKLGQDQRADNCEWELTEPGHKIDHHCVANGR